MPPARSSRIRAYDYGARDVTERDTAHPGIFRAIYEAQAAGGGIVELDSGVVVQTRQTIQVPAGVELVIPAGTTLRAAAGLTGDVVQITAASSNAGRVTGGGIIDANRAAGVQANALSVLNATDAVVRVMVTGAYNDGLVLSGAVRPVLDVVASANGRHGVYSLNSSYGSGRVTARDNGQRIAGSGLVLESSTDNAYAPIVATDTRAGGSKTQLYGVLEIGGSDRNPVVASALSGNATGAMSLVGASSGAAIQTGSVVATSIAAGAVGTAALADQSVTAAKLATDVARANLLTNPGFEMWQRGNGPYTAGGFTADRWGLFLNGTDTASVSKDTTNRDNLSNSALACAFTLGTGAGQSGIYQNVKPSEGYGFKGATVALSIRVRTATVNAVRVRITSDGAAPASAYSAYHPGDGTFQTLRVSVAIPTDATNVQVTLTLEASCTVYLDNAVLAVGAAAGDYVPMHPADELARCVRYCKVIGTGGANDRLGTGQAISATGALLAAELAPPMAVAPSVTVSAPGDWSVRGAGGGLNACTALVAAAPTTKSYELSATVAAGLAAGGAAQFIASNTSARITLEANP